MYIYIYIDIDIDIVDTYISRIARKHLESIFITPPVLVLAAVPGGQGVNSPPRNVYLGFRNEQGQRDGFGVMPLAFFSVRASADVNPTR